MLKMISMITIPTIPTIQTIDSPTTSINAIKDNIILTLTKKSPMISVAHSYVCEKFNRNFPCEYDFKEQMANIGTMVQRPKKVIQNKMKEKSEETMDKIKQLPEKIVTSVWMAKTAVTTFISSGTLIDHEDTNECSGKNDIDSMKKTCKPLQRIFDVLQRYNKCAADDCKKIRDCFSEIEQQQLFNDFMHIKIMHIDADNDNIRSHDHHEDWKENEPVYNNIGVRICDSLEQVVQCEMKRCKSFERHYQKQDENHSETNEAVMADITFQQELDKVHTFFFQFSHGSLFSC